MSRVNQRAMTRIATLFVLVVIWRAPAYSQVPPLARDDTRIREIVADQTAAWNRGDARVYSDRLQSHGVFTLVDGSTDVTRIAHQERMTRAFATHLKDTLLTQTIRTIRFLSPDVVIVQLDTTLASAQHRRRTAMLQVFVRKGSDWLVAALHDVEVTAP